MSKFIVNTHTDSSSLYRDVKFLGPSIKFTKYNPILDFLQQQKCLHPKMLVI